MASIMHWMEEGREKGKHEQAVAMILHQLPWKIGAVKPYLQEEIEALSLSALEDLSIALLKFSDSNDLELWLERTARKIPLSVS
ncbi:DUF4351 domain-containing protein [Roseofilum reptotaenium CS-1145]|uniref:DUF4351 domain-containing protein n=1 Tax=Roseofilum reptotaenium AO1-A TaxID=1925591 RepID=A0A1L9QR03_9CYAN|nr:MULTISPECIES: DUF4351 domain-containing protein [Roseofilum]MBP0031156.1 DUF4351 domain-containing protein [Roseofilum sp. Guam]MDB9516107.1 DUF4351 domain-containing protein [Roseofilum reptotaenium CS-1145]OJJ25056.1 hypothetical protein BI308_13530 [Roseofilum reptotaenium AO1-A]